MHLDTAPGSIELPTAQGGRRLLVVDPHPRSRHDVVRLAVKQGDRAWGAATAAEAVDLARWTQPEAILVDPFLPDLPPLAILDVLRHDPATVRVPVIAIGPAGAEALVRSRGIARYLPRPVLPPLALQWLREAVETPPDGSRGTVLVVDDEPAWRELAAEVLRRHGFAALIAEDAATARTYLETRGADLVILDIRMPGESGLSALAWIRRDPRFRHVPVILVTATSGRRAYLDLLCSGADDCLVKPFDPEELVARATGILSRARERACLSPNTLLPGADAIREELDRRDVAGEPFAFCYLDLDHFKAYNDTHGYAAADAVIRQLAASLRRAVAAVGPACFLGHVAGDDFVLIGEPARCERVAGVVLAGFDAVAPLAYRPEDRRAGGILAEDRFGCLRRFPIMTLTGVGILCHPPTGDPSRIAVEAAVLKARAKRIPHSVFVKGW